MTTWKSPVSINVMTEQAIASSLLFGPWSRFKLTRVREGAEPMFIVTDAETTNEDGLCAIVAWAHTKDEAIKMAYNSIGIGEKENENG